MGERGQKVKGGSSQARYQSAAVQRDLFEKRRRMMDDWAKFLARVERKGEVVPINTQAA